MLTPTWIFLLFAGAAGNALRSGAYTVAGSEGEGVSPGRTGRGKLVPGPAYARVRPHPRRTFGLRKSRAVAGSEGEGVSPGRTGSGKLVPGPAYARVRPHPRTFGLRKSR